MDCHRDSGCPPRWPPATRPDLGWQLPRRARGIAGDEQTLTARDFCLIVHVSRPAHRNYWRPRMKTHLSTVERSMTCAAPSPRAVSPGRCCTAQTRDSAPTATRHDSASRRRKATRRPVHGLTGAAPVNAAQTMGRVADTARADSPSSRQLAARWLIPPATPDGTGQGSSPATRFQTPPNSSRRPNGFPPDRRIFPYRLVVPRVRSVLPRTSSAQRSPREGLPCPRERGGPPALEGGTAPGRTWAAQRPTVDAPGCRVAVQ